VRVADEPERPDNGDGTGGVRAEKVVAHGSNQRARRPTPAASASGAAA
jgi:hypothetical protein